MRVRLRLRLRVRVRLRLRLRVRVRLRDRVRVRNIWLYLCANFVVGQSFFKMIKRGDENLLHLMPALWHC